MEALQELAYLIGDWEVVSVRATQDPDTGFINPEKTVTDEDVTSTFAWIADDKIILETFNGKMGGQIYSAAALRVYNSQEKKWEQRWTDSGHGGFAEYTGHWHPDLQQFIAYDNKNGSPDRKLKYRERFYDIEENRFSWIGEFQAPTNEEWRMFWRLEYTRLGTNNA